MDTYPLAFLSISATNILWFSVIVVLVIFSAFFSMSETAFSSLNDSKIRVLVEDRKAGAKKALQLREKFDKTLIVLLIGNNLVNVAISTLFVLFLTKLAVDEDTVTWLSTLIVTVSLLIFGEILPKVIAKQHAEGVACKVAWPVYIISLIFTPFTYLFLGLQKIFTRNKTEETKMNEDELGVLIDQMEGQGSIEHDEASTIRKVFDLNDRTAEDIMVPRIKMEAIDYNSSLEEVKEFMLDNAYSRIPVYKKDKDQIVGILYERDFYPAIVKNPKASWRRLLRPVKFVAATMKADDLIKELQASKTHLAVVSGEYGEVLGIVTMEDALEELVGEIYDEHDDPSLHELKFELQEDGSYIVDAEMFVDELFDRLNVGDIPEDVPTKISGWLFENCESIPEVGFKMDYFASYTMQDSEGEYVDYNKMLTFEIYEVKNRAITLAKVYLRDATEEEIEASKEDEE